MVTIPRRWLPTMLGALLLASSAGVQGDPQDRAQTGATFRVETRLVEVDVFVTDRHGQFVRGLTRDDFELFEDGHRREIAGLSVVHLPRRQPHHAPETVAEGDPLDQVVSNIGTDGRRFVMILGAIGIAPRIQSIAARFVERWLAPHDRVAVIHVGRPAANQAFTTSAADLLASIARACGSRLPRVPADGDCATGGSDVGVLREVLEFLRETGGRRTAVLFISGAGVESRDADELADLAISSHATLYVLDPGGMPPPVADLTRELPPATRLGSAVATASDEWRWLAERTGGMAITGSNNWGRALEEAITGATSYYLLGYDPAPDMPGDSVRSIEVRVARGDVAVRARPSYMPPWIRIRTPGRAPAQEWRVPISSGVSPEIPAALGNPFPLTELPLELFAVPFRGNGGHTSMLLGAHLAGHALRIGAGMRIEVAHAIAEPGGEVRGVGHAFTLMPTLSERAAIARDGLRFFDRIELAPGRHELRFTASQLGIAGSLATHINVPDLAEGPIALSGLVLASTALADNPTLQSDGALDRLTGIVPTTRRRFARSDELQVSGELYVNDRSRPLGATVSASISSEAGVEVQTFVPVVHATGTDGRTQFTVRLPLQQLQPGSYRLVVEARSDDADVPAVNRVLSFAIDSESEPPDQTR